MVVGGGGQPVLGGGVPKPGHGPPKLGHRPPQTLPPTPQNSATDPPKLATAPSLSPSAGDRLLCELSLTISPATPKVSAATHEGHRHKCWGIMGPISVVQTSELVQDHGSEKQFGKNTGCQQLKGNGQHLWDFHHKEPQPRFRQVW